MRNIAADNIADLESIETTEWLDSLDYVLQSNGPARAGQLLLQLSEHARRRGIRLPFTANTPYVNTLTTDQEVPFPGSQEIERRIKSLVRWNAIAMVLRANKNEPGIGGHISTFASAATLYEVGFNHFFRSGSAGDRDVVYYQGHASPGIYSRAFLEGRLTEKQLDNFRRELAPGGGLSSYPHPWLMPDFWEYPTVSMGLGPIMAIYQARFIRYLEDRGLKKPSNSKVWAFLGDGETDEPESLGAITLPAREKLDNLIFVVNCNLQRLDGPVRGNGQIIQELEAVFRGAGWNVIKVLWGKDWDPLLAKDKDGLLVKRMGEIVDGEYQKYTVESGEYLRKHFWGKYPQLLEMVKHLSDDELKKLTLGGHDPVKVYNAYKAAVEHKGQPTVLLIRTIKGYGLGDAAEGKNITHQQKKLTEDELRAVRERFSIPVPEEKLSEAPYYRPDEKSPEVSYLKERRKALGGSLPIPQQQDDAACRAAEPGDLRGVQQGHRRPCRVDDDGVRAAAVEAAARSGHRQAGRADRARRSAHVRHGIALPAGRHLLARRPALRAGRHGHAPLLQGVDRRPDSRGRDQRGRLARVVHCRRHRVFDARRQHDPVLHLLLDVRVPARRRSHLGRRRFALPRLPARRHRRPHDARGRRAAASGRQQPRPVAIRCRTACPTIRRSRTSLPSIIEDGIKRMYVDQESIFYYLTLMNDNYAMPPMPEGADVQERHPEGDVSLQQGEEHGGEAEGAAARQRRDSAGSHQGGRAARAVRRGGRCVERDELRRAVSRWQRVRSLEHAAPVAESRACRTWPSA